MTDLIDYSQSDFIAWQAEREAMRAENKRLREALWRISIGFCTAEGMKSIADWALGVNDE